MMDKQETKRRWRIYGWVLVLALLLLGFGHHWQREGKEAGEAPAVPRDADRVVKMDVEGLTPGRVDRLRECLLAVQGVHSVEPGSSDKEVVVRFDIARTDLHRIRQALEAAGFTPYFH